MARAAGAPILLILSLFLDFSFAQIGNNTACASGQLDWYTSVVGETPCQTYQRLRQICNNDYRVPIMASAPPGDMCDDQVTDCCCNTISFQLSMLCMNCQKDTVDGATPGIDAAPGTYQRYLNKCKPSFTEALPQNIQNAVCNENIPLDDFLYTVNWSDGSWFYVWSKENAETEHAANNNHTFAQCSAEIFPPSSSSLAASTTDDSSSTSTSSSLSQSTDGAGQTSSPTPAAPIRTKSVPNGGTVAGIVIGIVGILVIVSLTFWFARRHQRNAVRTSRPSRWMVRGRPQMRLITSGTRAYTPQRIPTPPVSAPQLAFSPDAMVRNPTHNPLSRDSHMLGRSEHARQWDAESREDSRVGGAPIDDSPDPDMPLMPLRLEPDPDSEKYPFRERRMSIV